MAQLFTSKRKDFQNYLETTVFLEGDRENLLFFLDFLSRKHDGELSSKIFAISGSSGLGKTYLLKKLLECVKTPIIFTGCLQLRQGNVIHCRNLKEVFIEASKRKSCVIALDDVDYVTNKNELMDICDDDKRSLMSIFDLVANSRNIGLILTLNNIYLLDSQMRDRVEVKMEMGLPSYENKLKYLNDEFGGKIQLSQFKILADMSIGYNYRDLKKIIRLAYLDGKGSVKNQGIRKILRSYTPPSLEAYDVYKNTGVRFDNVVGKHNIKKILLMSVRMMKNTDLARKLGVTRSNFLLFHGPPGTGKTYLAKALAGEINWPLISVKGRHIFSGSSLSSVKDLMNDARRFSNCVIFVDEAEKILARNTMDEDNPLQADLQSELDGIDGPVKSLIIFAVNDLARFGGAIQDRFNLIEFNYPGEDERREFIEQKIKQAKEHIKVKLDTESLVSMTVNMSFRAIEKAWNEAVFKYLDTKEAVSTEDFSKFLRNANNSAQEEITSMFG